MEPQPQKPAAKHEAINSAIENMASVTEHIKNIIERIQGNDKTGEGKAVAVNPPTASLCDVLNSGADRIRTSTDLNHGSLNELEQILF